MEKIKLEMIEIAFGIVISVFVGMVLVCCLRR